ncbi:MAG: F0F1 ATP synthase subunit A [Firmicutes bacterium]|nr:F0F1 ATP synthase subunit A [Bacillota bacterium]
MLNVEELGARIIISFGNGSVYLTESTLWGTIVAAFLAAAGIIMGSRLEKVPQTRRQLLAEFIVEKLYSYGQSNLGKAADVYMPFLGTMFLYLLCGSALGVLGVRPVTADVNVTFSLSILSFLLIQGSSIHVLGIRGKVEHMCRPYPFMFPLNLIEQVTLPVSLAFRLFGNIFGGLVVVELWYVFMEWLSSFFGTVPFFRAVLVLPVNAFFDMFEPAIQTYIFVTLTMVFLARETAADE